MRKQVSSTIKQLGREHWTGSQSMTGEITRMGGYWFSKNPDRAWAEKFYLIFIPFFFAYNAAMQKLGWLDTGNFWNIVQNLIMWLPAAQVGCEMV